MEVISICLVAVFLWYSATQTKGTISIVVITVLGFFGYQWGVNGKNPAEVFSGAATLAEEVSIEADGPSVNDRSADSVEQALAEDANDDLVEAAEAVLDPDAVAREEFEVEDGGGSWVYWLIAIIVGYFLFRETAKSDRAATPPAKAQTTEDVRATTAPLPQARGKIVLDGSNIMHWSGAD